LGNVQNGGKMEKITYQVPGISCGHCVNTIQLEVGELDGVSSVVADAETKTVTIEYGEPVTENRILELLDEINYPAQMS
jgi:copper ion binding protein